MEEEIKESLNKSFCNEKETETESIKYAEIGMINRNKISNFNTLNNSSDPQFSGLLPTSTNKKLLELSKSSNEINLFNSSKIKEEVPNFFRQLTRTKEYVTHEENQRYCEKIFNHLNSQNEGMELPEVYSPINSELIHSRINFAQGQPNLFDINRDSFADDSLISTMNIEKLFTRDSREQKYKKTESSILERNSRKFQSFNLTSFNVLVAGESGSGKTTFIKCFQKFAKKKSSDVSHKTDKVQNATETESSDKASTFQKTSSFEVYNIQELNFKNYNFNLIDSPGYGSLGENRKWISEIKSFIKSKFEMFQRNKREDKKERDPRIHCILYFITGPPKYIDFSYMKELSNYANIIPIICKGDSLTKDEILSCKEQIINEAKSFNIQFFDVQSAITKLSESESNNVFFFKGDLGSCPPFLIVSSLTEDKNKALIREYTWGICDITNKEHSDFTRLYYALSCYIRFECIDSTKKFYKMYKEKHLHLSRAETIKPNNTVRNIFYVGAIVLAGMIGWNFIKKKIAK